MTAKALSGSAFISDSDDVSVGASQVLNTLAVESTGAGNVGVTGALSAADVYLTNQDGDVDVNATVTANSVDINAEGNVGINGNVNANAGPLNIHADTDADGVGNVTVAAGTNSFSQQNATVSGQNVTNNGILKALNLDIDAADAFSTGVGSKIVARESLTVDAQSVTNKGRLTAKAGDLTVTTTTGNVVNKGTMESLE